MAIANGDVQYIDIIAQECKGLDVFGTNVYRGISARDLFQVVQDKLGVPVMFTEFGADAFNAREMREDQATQARYLIGQWQEIYEQSTGKGRVGNAIGGFIFQWSDGWWKFGQESRLDVHDTNASWPNGGYVEDFVEGENNMNEEWWGICAKGPPDARGLFDALPARRLLRPAAAPSALAALRARAPTSPPSARTSPPSSPAAAALEARGDRASLRRATRCSACGVSGLRLRVRDLSAPAATASPRRQPTTPQATAARLPGLRPACESFYADVRGAARPSNVTGTLSLNVLGNVPEQPHRRDLLREPRPRRGPCRPTAATLRARAASSASRSTSASVSWDDRWFRLDGFYRTGHFHWGYEGDFFGLYRDAYYGENIDIYNGEAPVGVEIARQASAATGLKVAFGPQLWWGANPAVLRQVPPPRRRRSTPPASTRRTSPQQSHGDQLDRDPAAAHAQGHAAALKTSRGPVGARGGRHLVGRHEGRRRLPDRREDGRRLPRPAGPGHGRATPSAPRPS